MGQIRKNIIKRTFKIRVPVRNLQIYCNTNTKLQESKIRCFNVEDKIEINILKLYLGVIPNLGLEIVGPPVDEKSAVE